MARTPLSLPFDGKRLRELRERRGWYQVDLAKACTEQGTPVSRSQVARAETGRNLPLPETLRAFAKALEVEIDDLLTAEDDEPELKAS